MQSVGFDRRAAPRFNTRFSAELASGSAIMRVQVSDVSVTGCCIDLGRFSSDMAIELGVHGVLSLQRPFHARCLLLPVIVCNKRVEHRRWKCGLQFRGLSPRLMKQILGLIEDLYVP